MRKNLVYYSNKFKTFYAACFKQVLHSTGLTQIEADILLYLENNPDYNTAKDICNLRGMAKSNVSKGISDLEKRNLLISKIEEENKKIHRLYLTQQSKTVILQLIKQQKECMDSLLRGFSEEEKQMMKDFFIRMSQNIENETEHDKQQS